ncbi:hypothetical protein IBL26_00315 [Roseomonas aerophila]|uniref:2-oxoglutarate-dependent ethylene/succinate-forming enzyme n=1 Tax=Teichococcus aerophilus TaxID=1224513 RepID=A0ABR7RFG1_9PROT|nr:hypothetical protein [Pseudoroseomonas aerophila]
MPQAVIDGALAAARQFHDQPLEKKLELRINTHNLGYLPMRGNTIRHSGLNKNNMEENEFGLAPHTDTGFMTLLAQNDVPGLNIGTRDGRWIDAPAIPGTFIVNGGDMLRRWTNDRFLATPHRVINRSGKERYSIPLFFDTTLDDPMSCLPNCSSPDNPLRYEPITLMQYMLWHQKKNLDALAAADTPGR